MKPIHSALNSVAHRWRAVYKYYTFIIRGTTYIAATSSDGVNMVEILRLAELLDGEPVQQPDGDYTGNLKYGIKKINITYDVKGAIQSVELWTDDLDCKYENSTGEYTVNKI